MPKVNSCCFFFVFRIILVIKKCLESVNRFVPVLGALDGSCL